MSNYWKKKLDELEKEKKNNPSGSYWDRKAVELKNEELRRKAFIKQKEEEEDDIAPIKSKEDDGKLDFFQKSSLFDDGWDFGDITKTILGSVGDAGVNAVKGVGGLVEGITDLASYGVAGVADAIGKDSFADDLRKKTQASYVDKLLKPAEDYLDKSSILGRTSDAILQGVGQIGSIMATGGLGAAGGLGAGGVTALTTGVMGLSGMGSGMGEAYKGGATDEKAVTYGAISGAADAISELIFGGLGKAVNAVGFSRGLSSADDMLAKKVSSMFSNQIAKNLSEFGIKAGAEGFEEVLAGIAQAAGKKATYMSEEEFGKILEDENLLEQFVVGAVTSGIAQAPGLHRANKTGSDFITGLNQNEQAVVKKEIENRIAEAEADGTKLTKKEKAAIEAQVEKDLEKGYISTDLIDEIVGGETYKAYKDSVDREDALFKEYEELGKTTNPTLAQQYRYRELDSRVKSIKDNDLRGRRKEHLDQFVSEQVNGSRLAESYNERTRRGQAFEADLTKYDAKQKAVIQKAIDSGILNNTNRTHEFVDMVAKISADKGVLFDFTNNEKLKTSGFAVDGKAVNGYVTKDGITVNIQSSKALNSIVGHEITHVLEGTDLYTELQSAVVEYAKTKGDYQGRFDSLSKLYEAVEGADINAEITADLVGDYLFTDSDFINNLSTQHRNVFQKIYDEVKYLLKVATAGSKEARELEKVKRAFEKAYREGENARESEEISDSKTKYSIREEAPPKNTGVAYKVFYVKDGKLYPPMVANPGGADTPIGVWLNADMGTAAPPSKTGRAQVKAGGKGTQGGSGSLAFRPGWHLGDLPRASQFDRVNPETGKKELFPENFVWAEVEYAKDVDYQEEAMSYGYTDKGKFRHAYAGLPKLPENGYYRYRTNPKPDTVPWVITGAMKVNRLLSDAEVNAILEKNGVPPVHRQGGDVGLDKFGFNDDGTVKYSLSDSDGNQLTQEQAEYFKKSKMRDDNGNLKPMYHGTQNGGFHVFDPRHSDDHTSFFFVDNNDVAMSYSGTSETYKAKTIRTAEDMNNFLAEIGYDQYEAVEKDGKFELLEYGDHVATSETAQGIYEEFCWYEGIGDGNVNYKVYLNLENPLEVDANGSEWNEIQIPEEHLAKFNESVFGKTDANGFSSTATTRNFSEYANAQGYDGVIFKNILDVGGYGGKYNPHTVAIAFDSNQIKSVANEKPTSAADIRFSLSEAVEETKDLLAVHNLTSEQVLKSLELGGLPMPSIAVLKADSVHDEYGDVSLILPKNAIDPKANKANKVYGGDAWTPVYPRIEYKPSKAVEKKISDKYYGLAREIGYDAVRPLYNYVTDLERQLNNASGETAMLEKLYDDTDMMNLYLQDSGKGKIDPIEKETVTRISPEEAKMNQFFIDALGEELISSVWIPKGVHPANHRKAFMEQNASAIEETYKRYCMEEFGFTAEEAENVLANTSQRDLLTFVRDAARYIQNNGVTVKTEIDSQATQKAIREAAADGYKEWVDGLFNGVEEKTGIRNNQDYYTRTGNPRSWDALHWANTLENVVKVMKGQEETGTTSFSPYNSFASLAHKRYGSIAEVKADSNRLGKISEEEYEAMGDAFAQRFVAIANSIKDPGERNSFIAADNAAEAIVDAVRTQKSKAGILKYLQEWSNRATEQTVDDIVSLVNDIANMPTGYFEAKPQRAVGFEEVGVFVIPKDADVKLKQELLNRGYSIAEYDPNVEGDRQRVVNQFEEFKFSLSDAGATPKTYGNYNVYGKDVALEVAPVQEEVSPVVKEPLTTVAENTTTAEESSVAEMFPGDLAPVQQELDNLLAEQMELRQALETAMDQGDYNQVSRLTADYEAVTGRIRELQAQEDEQFSSLSDTDMPPEAEAPYPGEPNEVSDPFAERDIVDVGNRSVKAYQYENPEVKPFFTEAALGMLYDLRNGTKGEKIFNGDVYYQSGGEEGWMGTKRQTTADIAELLDTWNYTYDQIEKGLNAIIEDDGKENNAVSKRIEFMLNDRLMNGYTGVWGEQIPANQEYINLLNEKQITEYSREAFDRFMATADQYAPPAEDIAPVQQKPGYVSTGSEQMKLPLYHDPNNVSPAMAEVQADGDIAPVFETESGQQAIFPDTDVPKAVTRKELHASIIDKIKTRFAERGFDLDAVLKNAKNLSTFTTVDNIPQRVMEKALGYKEGGILADFTVNKVAQNETQGIKWLNSFTDRKNGLLTQISKRYNIKPGSKESAAAQMYAEGFYVGKNNEIISYGDRELALDFPDPVKQAQIKGLARDPRIRKIYDDTLKAINESRTRNAYPEIPRLDNYFLHFRAMNDTFSKLGLPFNPNDIRAKDLPTDLNGVTADLKPGQPYFASAQHREGKRTDFDLLGGLEQYLTSAKNQIYHIDDIQNLRALRNYIADTYGQANGLEGLDALSEEEQQDRIEQVYGSHLSTFAKFLNEEANMLAGKTALIDRGLEGIIGRRGMTFLDTLNRQVGANMVGYNISSSLTNFLSPVQAFAKSNKADFIKGMAQFASNKVQSIHGNGDGFAEQSPVMIRRKGAERFHRTFWQKMSDPGYVLMSAVDDISTEIIARAKYNELTRKGMDSQTAHFETDKWVSRLMGDRSLGQQPQLYNSKMLGIITKFQLEVRNQLDSQFYDTIQEAKVSNEDIQNGLLKNAKTAAKVGSTFFQLAVAQHLFGKAFESIAGYNPAFDIISAIIKTFGWDDDEEDEDTVLDNIEQGFFELMGDMPYVSTFTGGRIPIESALPIEELYKGKDQYGNEKSRWETLGEAAPYYLLPGGYGQIKKTVAGMDMFSDEHPIAGSYTDSGNLRFPVEDTLANRAQAAVFGQYASGNARDYFDNERSALKPKQIQEFIDVGMSIQDYWKYRDGLSGLSKLEEKINYINGLNLTTAQKNVLVNNLTDRKEAIDMADYDQYDSLEEFDYANKYPEKYAFFDEIGITYETYRSADDDAKKAYDWALENPDKYPMSKAIASDVVEYRRYTSELYDIKADKDSSGKSISGSRKEKVLDYINSLDIDYGAKLILFKNEYNADDESNQEIIDYLNGRSDISFEEEVAILRELGFTVTSDGTIYWD